MAQNVTIAGASYSDVPGIDVPKTGGGVASFLDAESYRTASDQDVIDATKASKASNPTAGNVATLDASGNVVDSGKNVNDLEKFCTLLWTNASPESTWPNTATIVLDLSSYSYVMITMRSYVGSGSNNYNYIYSVGSGLVTNGIGVHAGRLITRNVNPQATLITFGNAQYMRYYAEPSTNNDYMIPYKVYGIK